MAKRRLRRLPAKIAREARRRYGKAVKLDFLPGRSGVVFIHYVDENGTCLDWVTVTHEKGCEIDILYSREVRLRWLPTDTAKRLWDDIEEIRCNPLRTYWKLHPKQQGED